MRSVSAVVVVVLGLVAASSAAAQGADTFPTGFHGSYPRTAVAPDGSLHLIFSNASPREVRHARLVQGTWELAAAVPGSDNAARAKYNLPSLALDPSSNPHVVWGPTANWQDATTHTKGVWYWDGATGSTTELFGDYTEYVSVGINTAGKKVFAAAVIFLPGDTVGAGIGWAEISGDTLGAVTRFSGADPQGKYVSFCKGSDGSLHLVWRMRYVRYARHDGSAWAAVEKLATSPGSAEVPSCVVDGSGSPHVAWLMWKDTGGGNWKVVDIRYAVKKGGAWLPSTDGVLIRALPDGGSSATVAVDPAGDTVLVAWSEKSDLFISYSTDSGATFSTPAAVIHDLSPADDNGLNQPTTPLFFMDGKFQAIYERSDGTLVRAEFTGIGAVESDAGVSDSGAPDAGLPDAGTGDGGTDSGVADAGEDGGTVDAAADAGVEDVSTEDAGGAHDVPVSDASSPKKDAGVTADGGESDYGIGCGCATVNVD